MSLNITHSKCIRGDSEFFFESLDNVQFMSRMASLDYIIKQTSFQMRLETLTSMVENAREPLQQSFAAVFL